MSLYAISDLHLSTNEHTGKSMEVFGSRWKSYVKRLENNWRAVVEDNDVVVIPGDISWAMTTDEAASDFKLLESLPGRKIIGKGNHDFWWSTASKLKVFFENNEIKSVELLHNNAYELDDYIICGTRGWFNDESQQNTVAGTVVDYQKIVNREKARLITSLNEGLKLRGETDKEILVFMHFPPVYNDFVCRELLDTLKEFGIKRCYFGHIHGNYYMSRITSFEGIDFIMIASDYLNFAPMRIFGEN